MHEKHLHFRAIWLTGINRWYWIPTLFTYWDYDCKLGFGISFEWLKFEVSLDSGY